MAPAASALLASAVVLASAFSQDPQPVDCLSRDAQVLVQRDVKVTLPLSVEEDAHFTDEHLANIVQDYIEDVVVVLHGQDERSLRPSEKSELDGNTIMQAMIEGISSCKSDAFIRDVSNMLVVIQNETRDFAAEIELESSWLVGNATSQMKVDDVAELTRLFYNNEIVKSRNFYNAFTQGVQEFLPKMPNAINKMMTIMTRETMQPIRDVGKRPPLQGNASAEYVCESVDEVLTIMESREEEMQKLIKMSNQSRAMRPELERYLRETKADVADRVLYVNDMEAESFDIFFGSMLQMTIDLSDKARSVLRRLPCELSLPNASARPSLNVLVGLAAFLATSLLRH